MRNRVGGAESTCWILGDGGVRNLPGNPPSGHARVVSFNLRCFRLGTRGSFLLLRACTLHSATLSCLSASEGCRRPRVSRRSALGGASCPFFFYFFILLNTKIQVALRTGRLVDCLDKMASLYNTHAEGTAYKHSQAASLFEQHAVLTKNCRRPGPVPMWIVWTDDGCSRHCFLRQGSRTSG